MAEKTARDLFSDLIPVRRELAKQMRLTSQRFKDLSNQQLDLNDSSDLIHDAIQDVFADPFPDLIEYAVLKAELNLTLADLAENEEEVQKILALQEKQQEAMQQLRNRMRALRLHAKSYRTVLPFRKAS